MTPSSARDADRFLFVASVKAKNYEQEYSYPDPGPVILSDILKRITT
jgi:hypothetical protein